ncbi:unnamed protein product [Calicophoron daubneyi]
MGTHPSGPSKLQDFSGKTLESYISENPSSLGTCVRRKFGSSLPFLFKVLSVAKALSIQAHPTKSHAEALHRQRPDLYKDSNHKPELAIALTPFEALLAFRPIAEIAQLVQAIPELLEIVGPESASDLVSASSCPEQYDIVSVAIKAAYAKLMRADHETVAPRVEALKNRFIDNVGLTLPKSMCEIDTKALVNVYLRLATDFPGDVGCFSLFFLNYVTLKPGEAVFLEANLPHAYISGDCIECMACSDNVVRAGLTPKFKDVDCLLSMLQYEPHSVNSVKFEGRKRRVDCSLASGNPAMDSFTGVIYPEIITYSPPVDDFTVDKIVIPIDCPVFELLPIESASILLIVRGSGTLQRLSGSGVELDSSSQQSSHTTDSKITSNQAMGTPAGRVPELLPFTRGSVFFISAGVSVCVRPEPEKSQTDIASEPTPLLGFRAYANVDFLMACP